MGVDTSAIGGGGNVDAVTSPVDTCAIGGGAGAKPRGDRRAGGENAAVSKEKAHSRYIPRAVAARVWQRDKGQCTYVAALSGMRCQCRRGLQIDHIVPFARGGSSNLVSNLRLLCPQHNRVAADDIFGREFMKAAEQKGRRGLLDDS